MKRRENDGTVSVSSGNATGETSSHARNLGHTKEEISRHVRSTSARSVPRSNPSMRDGLLVVDVITGDYEVADDLEASEWLLARNPAPCSMAEPAGEPGLPSVALIGSSMDGTPRRQHWCSPGPAPRGDHGHSSRRGGAVIVHLTAAVPLGRAAELDEVVIDTASTCVIDAAARYVTLADRATASLDVYRRPRCPGRHRRVLFAMFATEGTPSRAWSLA